MKLIAPYAKAILGAVLAGLGALYAVSADGITAQEWIGVVITTLATLGGVYAVPNKPAPPAVDPIA